MPGLGDQEPAVELLQGGVRQMLREQAHALTAAGLDKGGDQQRIEQPVRFLSPTDLRQPLRIRARALPHVRNPALGQRVEDFFEMAEFFFGQARQRGHQHRMVRVAKHEANGGRRRALFEMGVVEQYIRQQTLGRPFAPRGVGGVGQPQHFRPAPCRSLLRG